MSAASRDGTPFLAQRLTSVLFAHWPVSAEGLALPAGLVPDLFGGEAWISLVCFRVSRARRRWMPPLPFSFGEVNLRTYARLGDLPGVHFLSLDVGSRLLAGLGRRLVPLPFHAARIRLQERGAEVRLHSSRHNGDVTVDARYRGSGPVREAEPGSLDSFLCERTTLLAVGPRGPVAARIRKSAWPLQSAEAEVESTELLMAAGLPDLGAPSIVHFARLMDLRAGRPFQLSSLPAVSGRTST